MMKKWIGVFLITVILLCSNVAAENLSPKYSFDYFNYGDVTADQAVDAKDALLTLRVSVGTVTMDDVLAEVADVTGDGAVDATDALRMLQFAVEKIERLPAGDTFIVPADKQSEHYHIWQTKVTAAGCETQGSKIKICACNDVLSQEPLEPLGHNWGEWKVKTQATTQTQGTMERVCARCDEREEKKTDKLPTTEAYYQQEVLRLVNEERAKAGLSPLAYYSEGQAAADLRAEEIGVSFSHTRPNGESCFTVLNGISYRSAGENIAYGYLSPQQVVTAWMNSEGHRANILNNTFTHLVVGVKGTDWVQLFLGL